MAAPTAVTPCGRPRHELKRQRHGLPCRGCGAHESSAWRGINLDYCSAKDCREKAWAERVALREPHSKVPTLEARVADAEQELAGLREHVKAMRAQLVWVAQRQLLTAAGAKLVVGGRKQQEAQAAPRPPGCKDRNVRWFMSLSLRCFSTPPRWGSRRSPSNRGLNPRAGL